MHRVSVNFTSQARLVERSGVLVAAEIDGKPVLCHLLKDTLVQIDPKAKHANPLEIFRDQKDQIVFHISAKARRSGVNGDFFHLLPSDLRGAGLVSNDVPIQAVG